MSRVFSPTQKAATKITRRLYRKKKATAIAVYNKQWVAANRDKVNAYTEKYREANRDKVNEGSRLAMQAKAAAKQRVREDEIGRPRPEYCEACSRKCITVFDHCHTTSKGRGWLCQTCNLAIGNAYDNPDTLRKLAEYLERFAP